MDISEFITVEVHHDADNGEPVLIVSAGDTEIALELTEAVDFADEVQQAVDQMLREDSQEEIPEG